MNFRAPSFRLPGLELIAERKTKNQASGFRISDLELIEERRTIFRASGFRPDAELIAEPTIQYLSICIIIVMQTVS